MTREPGYANDWETPRAGNLCASLSGGVCASISGSWRTHFAHGPLNTVYAWVRDEDLGKVRRRVTRHTLFRPAVALPAAHLPCLIRELSLLAVRAQVDRLAYGVSEMVLAFIRMCNGPS